MRKMLFALVLALGVTEASSAQWNGPPAPQGPAMGGGGGNIYGWNPSIKRNLLWWKKDACNGGNCGAPGMGAPGTPGAQMPGTLVFPQHQFVRSPRDYFMWEGNK